MIVKNASYAIRGLQNVIDCIQIFKDASKL